jgi:hypothetical protein
MPSGVYYRSPELIKEMSKRLPHGNKHTPESKEKLRKAHLGKKLSEETKKKISLVQTGKKRGPRTLEFRKMMSDRFKGSNGTNWKGGLTEKNKTIRRSVYYKFWRESVFKRDNWTCQECKVKGGELHPHHIYPFAKYPDLRLVLANGQTLCKDCHKKTDTYGKN